jgi:tripartite-type tricarboxylate transporter receptor subunit TctC
MRSLVALLLSIGAAVLGVDAAQAQSWPTKSIKIVVGFAAGGSTDVTARFIGQALSERLGQPVIVENRPGAGGNIAADLVAKAEPDGYTLLLATSTTLATNPSLYKSLPFDVRTDFAPITLTAFIPSLLVITPSIPANNVSELIDYLKVNPGKVNFGSAGNGSSQHIAGELFNARAGVQMVHVAYGGWRARGKRHVGRPDPGPVCADGRGPPTSAIKQPKDNRHYHHKALAASAGVAPIADTLPGYEVALWNGLLAPSRTPPEIIDRINRAAVEALHSDGMKAKLANQGSDSVGSTAEEFNTFIVAELEKWRKLVELSCAMMQ